MHQYAPVGFDSNNLDGTASVVFVNYNGKEQLFESLPVWVEYLEAGYLNKIIVVDNASIDGSVSHLRENFPDIRIIENSENLGWGIAVNQGVEEVDTEYIFISTPDMIPTESWFFRLIQHLDRAPNTGLTTGIVVRPSGMIDGRGAQANRMFRFRAAEPSDTVTSIDAARGSALAVRTEAYRDAGGIDEDLFIQGGDINISMKIQESGWDAVYVPGALIWHCEKLNRTPTMLYYNVRNTYLLSARHLNPTQFLAAYVFNLFYHIFWNLYLYISNERSASELSDIYKGVLEGTKLAVIEQILGK